MKPPRLILGLVCAALLAASAPVSGASGAEAVNHGFLFEIHGFKGPGGNESFEAPCGVTMDPSGHIYVSDYYRERILVFATSGGVPAGQPGPPTATALAEGNGVDGPCGLAESAEGALYVNNYHQEVVRFAPGQVQAGRATQIDAAHSTGVAVDRSSGRVYVDDRSYVAVYEPSGEPVEVGGQPLRIGENTLGDGYGIAVSEYSGTAGLVYVADASTASIKVYDPSTSAQVGEISGEATAEGSFADLIDAALAVSPLDGHVYLAHSRGQLFEHPEALVDEFNSSGDYRGRILAGSLIAGEPTGIAVVPAGLVDEGDLFLTSGNNEAGKMLGLAPSGPAHQLKVAKAGAGTGEVASQPAGIRCGSACTAEFNSGATVTLTATPAPGSVFSGWTITGGGSCPGTGTCQIVLSSGVEVTATFEPGATAGAAPGASVASAPALAPAAPTAVSPASVGAEGGSLSRPGSPTGYHRRARRHRRARSRHRRHAAQRAHRRHRQHRK